ncbi:MAG: phage/plasmid primase, P4 family [Gammaproteobacteria bacterium]
MEYVVALEWEIVEARHGGCDGRDRQDVARSIFSEAAGIQNTRLASTVRKHAERTLQLRGINAMLTLAQSVPRIVAPPDLFDSDPLRLAVENGIVDLKTGSLLPHAKENYVTRISPVVHDSKARCPSFEAFIERIFDGDRELIAYVQRVLGYCLTGYTKEQVLFFLYGTGANGKSTFVNVIRALLGQDLFCATQSETFMLQRGGRSSSNDIARLQGIRVTAATEVRGSSMLNESLIKDLTGGDAVTARYLYREYFDFKPTLKLVMVGNHKPVIHGDDDGIWRRFHVIPFLIRIPDSERDPELLGKLEKELPGILNWALAGCREWLAKGLLPPKTVQGAINEYRSEMDVLGNFIEERCLVGDQHSVRAQELYMAYKGWCAANSLRPLTGTRFGRKMAERHKRTATKTGRVYHGISIKPYASNEE